MTSPKAPKDKFFKKVINPYLTGVLQYPQSIEMREGMLHICDVEGPKKTGSMEARLQAMEQHVFKCQGMVEHGLRANHMMITEFISKHRIDANDIGKHLPSIYDRIDHLQVQIYDPQNQNYDFGAAHKPSVVAKPHTAASSSTILPFATNSTATEDLFARRNLRASPKTSVTVGLFHPKASG
ncbi:40S ribosomal protein S5-1 [Hordeum vulgare]|nr:40S ribosomal protein S5-1 [Hordeum vulgare]